MSTGETWQTDCDSLEATLELAAALGSKLKGGEVIELVSDLGGGKTTFVKGLVAGMGSNDRVSSPSFTLSNEYRANKLRLYHFDFYRLGEPGIMRDELAEALADPEAVTAVEWGDIVDDVLPDKRVTITLTVTGEFSRHVKFESAGSFNYLIPDKL